MVARLQDRGSRFVKNKNFSLLNCVQTNSEAYPMGNGGSFSEEQYHPALEGYHSPPSVADIIKEWLLR
jgi:hypothetical protein